MVKQWIKDIQGIDGIEIEIDKDLRTFFGEIGDIGINIIFFDMISFNEKTNKY